MDKIITFKQQVYHILKRRIADGTYHHGQRLQENDLAADLKVSRSPVREALKQLVLEGILEETPNKGVSLRSFSVQEIRDVFDFRILVECYAIDFMADHPECFPLERLTSVRKGIQVMDEAAKDYIIEPQVNPHDTFVEVTGNDYLIEVHHRASFCTMSYHNALFAGGNYVVNLQQHLDIVDALLARDYKKAKEVLINHLENSRDVICKAISNGTA